MLLRMNIRIKLTGLEPPNYLLHSMSMYDSTYIYIDIYMYVMYRWIYSSLYIYICIYIYRNVLYRWIYSSLQSRVDFRNSQYMVGSGYFCRTDKSIRIIYHLSRYLSISISISIMNDLDDSTVTCGKFHDGVESDRIYLSIYIYIYISCRRL